MRPRVAPRHHPAQRRNVRLRERRPDGLMAMIDATDAAQDAFWEVFERWSDANEAHIRALSVGDEITVEINRIALVSATDALEAFRRDHDGAWFRVFRPEHIDRAFRDDIAPLVVDSGHG
jgi:hypothetical protein